MAITYCIVCNITGEKYYGSTKQTLEKRMSVHTSAFNCISRQIIQRGDYNIYPLHKYETIEEAKMKENWYINNKECINKNRVCVTKEERLQKSKEYREKNREKINAKQKIKREKNPEKIKEYYEKNKNCEKNKKYKKEYYEKNREKIKEYYEKNREKHREKVECQFCKKQLCRDSITKHFKSFHLDAILA